jgi:hypothetical protein
MKSLRGYSGEFKFMEKTFFLGYIPFLAPPLDSKTERFFYISVDRKTLRGKM